MLSRYPEYFEERINVSGIPVTLSLYNHLPGKPTVLFLPGTMVHPLFYDEFLSRIADAGFNVVGIHFISHGKSPHIKENFTFGDLVENTKAAIDFCLEHYGTKPVIMGSSQGSMVAMAAVADEQRICAVFLHDLLLPQLRESEAVISLPGWIKLFSAALPTMLRIAAKVFPAYQIGLQTYLDPERLTLSDALVERFLNDPLSRKSYPLSFMASLFNMDLSCACDGSLKVPLILITAEKDPLFTQEYMNLVYEKVAAPEKEMVSFDLPYHILFVEAVDEVTGEITEKLRYYFDKNR